MVQPRAQRAARAARLALRARFALAAAAATPLFWLWPSRAAAQPTDAGQPPSPPATTAPPGVTPGQASPSVPTTPSGPTTSPAEGLIPQDGTTGTDVNPARDQQKLLEQGRERPLNDGTIGARPNEVYSEDWWSYTRPIVELHGYFRTRGELAHNFSLGRHSGPGQDPANLWLPPLDTSYTDVLGNRRAVKLCGSNTPSNFDECQDKTQTTGNLRLRLNPEIHISDNLRILSQVDFLDNLILGSTPDSYAIRPSGTSATGYRPAGTNPYAPLGPFVNTQGPPTASVNGYRNSIDVKRAWAEYLTPVGQLRFGRMPWHWGLGMVYNSGDCFDCDWQTNVDRIMFVSGLKSADLYFGGSWDFVSTGPTQQTPYDVYGGQPYNTANLANVGEWSAFVVRRTNPELQRLKLSRGDLVVNGGLLGVYRSQLIDVKAGETPLTVDTTQANNGFERRGYETVVPDAWIQFLWNKLRVEAEFASVWGSIQNTPATPDVANDSNVKIRQWGIATQAELRAIEDKLRVGFGAGWASGDPNVEGLAPGANELAAGQRAAGGGAISTFRFHPAYYVDYIFFRRILSRVQGAYYFRPSVEYDFVRNPNGQKFGGGAAVIWSRASQFIQAPGNKRDLGVEIDLQLYYQAKDGSLNDDPNKMGGFYTALEYGVFFPMGGLEYLPSQQQKQAIDWSLSSAQTVRLLLGVIF